VVTDQNVLNYLAKDDLAVYIRQVKPDYHFNWHHLSVIYHLEKFEKGEIKKMMLFQPPQTGKTEAASRILPSYGLGKNPDRKIALCSYGAELSQSINRDVQRIIMGDNYNLIFPDTKLNAKNVATDARGAYKRTGNIFEVVGHKGFFKTVGVNGPLTGTPVDWGIIDDPIKDRQEAMSDQVRKKIYDWYTDVFCTRLHNDSQQLLMMTRWHEDDLAGQLLKEDGVWSEDNPDGWVVVIYEGLKESDFGDEFDKREIGEALWPEKHSRERYENIRDKRPQTFRSMYQQTPTSAEGNIIKEEWIEIVPKIAVPRAVWGQRTIMFADTSYTKKESNDPNGFLKVKVWGGRLWFMDCSIFRMEATEALDMFQKLVQGTGQNGPIFVENKASGLTYAQLLRNRMINAMEYKHPGQDKEALLRFVSEYFQAKRVMFVDGPWVESFKGKLKSYPNVKHDEEIDLTVMAIIILLIDNWERQSGH